MDIFLICGIAIIVFIGVIVFLLYLDYNETMEILDDSMEANRRFSEEIGRIETENCDLKKQLEQARKNDYRDPVTKEFIKAPKKPSNCKKK